MATAADSVVSVLRGAFPCHGTKGGLIQVRIDLPTVSAELVAQGDGVLATGDIIQCFTLPKGTLITGAGIQIEETVVGVAALPIALGVTGQNAAAFVVETDIGSSTSYVATDYLSMATDGSDGGQLIGCGAAGAATDTVDIVCGTVTATTITAGKLRVFAWIIDAGDMDGS